jgi:hypothetical protein
MIGGGIGLFVGRVTWPEHLAMLYVPLGIRIAGCDPTPCSLGARCSHPRMGDMRGSTLPFTEPMVSVVWAPSSVAMAAFPAWDKGVAIEAIIAHNQASDPGCIHLHTISALAGVACWGAVSLERWSGIENLS